MAPAAAAWGFSVHVRCSDAQIRHCLKGVALLVGLWMLNVILKYRYPIDDPQLIALLWYLYYVPMTLIPLLCLLCALRASALDARPWARLLRRAAWALSIAIIALVLTNSVHLQVFSFDISRPDWQDAYAYNWGYCLAVAVYVAEYLGFFAFLFVASRRRLHGAIALLLMAALPFGAYCLMYVLRHEFAVRTNFSLNYCLVVVALLELALDFGLLPSYSWYDEAFSRLPLDLRVLARDGSVAFATNVAGPMPAPVLDLALRVARSQARERVTRVRTFRHPARAVQGLRRKRRGGASHRGRGAPGRAVPRACRAPGAPAQKQRGPSAREQPPPRAVAPRERAAPARERGGVHLGQGRPHARAPCHAAKGRRCG